MNDQPYHTSSETTLSDLIGLPLRTSGCVLLYCTDGCATVECNFTEMAFRKGYMTLIFSDTLFSVKRISKKFRCLYFELSAALTDETTFNSSGAFLDWLYEYPVFAVPNERLKDMELWLSVMRWIDSNTNGKQHNMMLRNQWHNFFIGIESVLKHRLADRNIKTISSGRKLFNGFCKLLSENCRRHHEVKFYADKLCITPYYLSRITHRIFSVSPKELIDRQIIMEIKSLLTSTEMSIKEIAEQYNFESSSYLGRYFRRHVGMTPSEYRDL